MSIRPLDMQNMIPKSSKISSINQNLNNRSQNEQQLICHDFKQKIEIKNKQVTQPNGSEKLHNNINENKKGNHQKHNSKKNNEDEKKQKKNTCEKLESTHIDIKV